MRLLPILVVFALSLAGPATGAADDFPYTAYVVAEQTELRAGPSEDDYATQTLKYGERVEVFRHEPGGWLAIRPPRGSVSLIAVDAASLTEDQTLAEILKPDTPSWISAKDDQPLRLISQVELDQDELVEVTGRRLASLHEGGRKQEFHEISPPAGEFRWVRRGDVDRERPPRRRLAPPRDQVKLRDMDEGFVPRRPRSGESDSRAPNPDHPKSGGSDFAGAARHGDRPAPSRDAVDPRDARVWTAGRTRGGAESLPAPERHPASELDSTSLADLVNRINVQLSLMVARRPEQWDLSSLRGALESAFDSAATTADRAKVRRVLDRLDEFDALQRRMLRRPGADTRHEGNPSGRTSPPRGREPHSSPGHDDEPGAILGDPTPDSTSDDPAPRGDDIYDGRGWLMPLTSTQQASPPYALVDKQGRIIKLVTPAPGLNVQRYVKKEVAIIGHRGFISTLKMPHVMAERVIDLTRR